MADQTPSDNTPLDLSSLEGLSMGTAWSKSTNTPRSERSFGDRPHRDSFGGPRRDDRGAPRRDGPSGPRREGPSAGARRPSFGAPRRDNASGFRREGNRFGDRRSGPAPIVPPSIKVVFYPEETPFKALIRALKASHRTYELFEIARLLIAKPDRAVAVLSNIPAAGAKEGAPLYQCAADSSVFLTEAQALEHASTAAISQFFKTEEAEVEAPKGNFVVVHRCGISGKLIAPPNYHRYGAILTDHAAAIGKSVEAVKARLESVKEPEVIAAWVESMKKITRYVLITPVEGQPAAFDSLDAAREHLIAAHKSELVHALPQIRLSAKALDALPAGEIRRSVEAARALQTRFPLDTANNLRGRLRRMGFTLYKRGPKGVSYICAVKRKSRVVGQTFAPEVQQVLEFIEKTPMVTDVELPKQMLGITPPPAPAPLKEAISEADAAANAEPSASADASEAPALEAKVPQAKPAAPTAPVLNPEEEAAYKKLKATLQWLVEEGYVTYFGDGKLFVSPARAADAPKSEEEKDEAADEVVIAPEAEASAPEVVATEAPTATAEKAPEASSTPAEAPAVQTASEIPMSEPTATPAEEPKKG